MSCILRDPGPSRSLLLSEVYDADSPSRLVLEVLADKWALLVVDRLAGGPARFNALKRDVLPVTQKVLATVLRRLERQGLVSRRAYPTVPVTVEYALTPLGRKLSGPVSVLVHWPEQHLELLHTAQAAYDGGDSATA